jgi:hypothetical protein
MFPDLKVNLIHNENYISYNEYNYIHKLVDKYVIKYMLIYPNFFITYLDINIIDDDNYQIDESNIKFTYIKEITQFSQLTDNEKIYISKEKHKIIKLTDLFDGVKLRHIE